MMWPIFEAIINNLIDKANASGMPVGLHSGYRSWEKQDALYALGRTVPGKIITKAKGGESLHNFGLAADLVFRPDGKWSWGEEHPWSKLGELGKSLDLEWGGDFKTLPDRPHFQITRGMSLSLMRELYRAGGLDAVWSEIAQRSRK